MNHADCMHLSVDSMPKLANNRKILYFQTAVLAEPSDQSLFLYKTQPHCVGLVRKVDPPPPPTHFKRLKTTRTVSIAKWLLSFLFFFHLINPKVLKKQVSYMVNIVCCFFYTEKITSNFFILISFSFYYPLGLVS
jgi:hypothetical protein